MGFEESEAAVDETVSVPSDLKLAVEQLVAQMSRDDRAAAITAGRKLWSLVRRVGRPDAGDERADVESQLSQSLDAKQPMDVDREILWMISEIGGDTSVDTVAARLSNRDLREDARMVLERIPGGKALAALRLAFETVDEDFRPNIAQSLRARGVQIEGAPCQKLLPVKGTDVRAIR